MKWVKRILLALVVMLVLGALVYGFLPKPVAAEQAGAAKGDLLITIDGEARTRVRDRFTVYAPVGGTMERVTLKPGDAVQPGSVVTTLQAHESPLLDPRSLSAAKSRVQSAQAALERAHSEEVVAQARLALSEKELENLTKLEFDPKTGARRSLVPQERLDAAALNRDAAAAAVNSARFAQQAATYDLAAAEAVVAPREPGRAESAQVLSPVAGKVLRVMRDSAGPVLAGEALVEIGNPSSIEVVADLLSRDAVRASPGMEVVLDRWGGAPLQGRVRLVEPFGFTKFSALGVEEQRVNVVIDIVSPPAEFAALGDGFRVEARLVLLRVRNAIKVPDGAVFRTTDGHAVFVVERGKAVRREVEIGERNGIEAEVINGLKPGESVVVHPGDAVRDGVQVTEP